MEDTTNPAWIKNNLFPFLSETLPKNTEDNICARLNAAMINPISKNDCDVFFAIMGRKTNVIETPAFWKNVEVLTKLFVVKT